MAIFTDTLGLNWAHADDKVGFDAWILEDPARVTAWKNATAAHIQWMEENPGADQRSHTGDSAEIWAQWEAYSGATPVR
jgi:hypothetical protein